MTDAFFAVNSVWEFTYINSEATRILLRSQEDLIGRRLWDEFPEAVHLTFYNQYHKAMREQVTVEFEAYYPPLKALFKIKAYPSVNGLLVCLQDSTRKDRLPLHAASIAHEIRNPLTSIKGFIQLIEKSIPEDKKDYFKIMMDELTRIEDVILLLESQAFEKQR